MGRTRLWLVHPDPDTVRVLRGVRALRAELAHSLGFRHDGADVWCTVSDGRALCLGAGRTCARRCAVPAVLGAMAGAAGFSALSALFLSRHACVVLVWLGNCSRQLALQRSQWNSPARIQIYFFKTLIPLAGLLADASGFRRTDALLDRDAHRRLAGRLDDVRETEDMLMHMSRRSSGTCLEG